MPSPISSSMERPKGLCQFRLVRYQASRSTSNGRMVSEVSPLLRQMLQQCLLRRWIPTWQSICSWIPTELKPKTPSKLVMKWWFGLECMEQQPNLLALLRVLLQPFWLTMWLCKFLYNCCILSSILTSQLSILRQERSRSEGIDLGCLTATRRVHWRHCSSIDCNPLTHHNHRTTEHIGPTRLLRSWFWSTICHNKRYFLRSTLIDEDYETIISGVWYLHFFVPLSPCISRVCTQRCDHDTTIIYGLFFISKISPLDSGYGYQINLKASFHDHSIHTVHPMPPYVIPIHPIVTLRFRLEYDARLDNDQLIEEYDRLGIICT